MQEDQRTIEKSLGLLTMAFDMWVAEIEQTSKDIESCYQKLLIEHLSNYDADNYNDKKVTEIISVNCAGLFFSLADRVRKLHHQVHAISVECNNSGGKRLDLGEVDDVIRAVKLFNKQWFRENLKPPGGGGF